MLGASELAAIAPSLLAQWLPREVLDRRRAAGLRAMVEHCRTNVPYYRGPAYDAGPLERVDDLVRFPPLTKGEVLQAGEEAFVDPAIPAEAVVFTRTSGTSGQRLEVRHDLAHYAYHNAACIRRFLATGRYRPWFRLCHIRPGEMPSRWYQRLRLFRRTVVDSFLPPDEARALLLAERPHAIIGYPTMLRQLLRILDPAELAQVRSGLRLLFTESELLVPEHRRQLEQAFGVPVFDEYSAYEVLNIAFECDRGSLHVAEDRIALEVLDGDGEPAGAGEEGRVAVTAFQERAMPLVRYWLGDRGRLLDGGCACGRTFRRLELTSGRADDHVTLPDGSMLYVSNFLYLAAEEPGVAECYVRQDREGLVTVHVVPDGGRQDGFVELARRVEASLYRMAKRPFALEVRRAEQLEVTPGGKGKFLVSEYRP